MPSTSKTPAWERGFVEPLRTAQAEVLRPTVWIPERFRFSQRWALYQRPSRDRFRLWIEGRDAGGSWHVLFRAGDAEHQEDADLIDYTRPRGAWDPVGFLPMQYPLFAEWVIERMLARHTELAVIRVQLERVTLTSDGLVPSGTFVETRARNRGRSVQ